jgi:hypothetical protein
MKKAELKELMNRHHVLDFELDNVIGFVEDLLHTRAKELEENEPYATNTINRIVQASHEVYDLLEYVEECEED